MISQINSVHSITQTYIQGFVDKTKNEGGIPLKEQDSFVPSDKYNEYLQAVEELEQIPALSKQTDNYLKCVKIAQRMIAGEKVSMKDKMFLIKNAPDLYTRALLYAINSDKPKDSRLKDISGDEDDEKSSNETKSSVERVAPVETLSVPQRIEETLEDAVLTEG